MECNLSWATRSAFDANKQLLASCAVSARTERELSVDPVHAMEGAEI